MVKAHARTLVAWFAEDEWPSIECPVCADGHLSLVRDGEASKVEWAISAATKDYDDPDEIRGTFGSKLRCSNSTGCGDFVYAAGHVKVDYARDFLDRDNPFVVYFSARWFYPPLRVVDVPPGTPDTVRDEIDKVGALIWSNPDAALWSLRKAVEILLDEQGVDRLKADGFPLSLKQRLGMFGATDTQLTDVVDLLQATRLVGNEGTHASGRSGKDVLSIIQFVELALESLYSESERDAALTYARKINANKGYVPPSG